ncbi:Ubiquitin carboxyl-terminal hydrolase 25 [Carex littledalei]|uniref:Ubiquitin carboxyl-terminal hydrolase 25 n=1 Tax=Carex littledalei TaxID=544730 RepID=A0A833QMF7_9POAL|nr:Ubiquitin carboxyl-terminal hydrolase 25 [Carex littledalei]
MDLSLDVCHSTSVKDALARFFQPEILDGSNKYSCESTGMLLLVRAVTDEAVYRTCPGWYTSGTSIWLLLRD